ncbi:MAG: cell wall hydrolase [Sphingomonadales bacterium]|nr:cell wall hydrolase [Sphingomonadales bacterium]
MRFKAPGESFPGLAADDGVADPPPAMPGAGDAAPARFAGASPLDRGRALTCLTTAIYYEAATEPDDGQQAVAQVVLNRLAHPAFPKTVCGVVYQGSERPDGCQFTFACDGSLTRAPAPFFWRRAEAVARSALAGAVFAPIGLATHYHAFTVHPAWADALAFVGQIGAHRFYRMEGAAGAAGAFRFAYAGGEPLPLPHLRAAAALAPAPDPLTIERAPAYPARGGDAALRMAEPAAGDIRPEYRASGSWIAQPM